MPNPPVFIDVGSPYRFILLAIEGNKTPCPPCLFVPLFSPLNFMFYLQLHLGVELKVFKFSLTQWN